MNERRGFSAKTKLAAWQRCGGRCEIPSCGVKLHPSRFIYDHRNPDYFGGEPTLENCQVICRECDKIKTGGDMTTIAKSKRIRKREAGVKRPRTIRQWRRFDGTPVFASRERS